MKLTESFNENSVCKDREIIVYGAGVYGEIAYQGLEYMGVRPDFFCDKNRAGEMLYCDINVIAPEELCYHRQSQIILASYNYFYEMYEECREAGCEAIYDMEYILSLPIESGSLSGRAKGRLHDISGYKKMLENTQDAEHVYLNHVDFVVCENCTLRCEECANLISHYKHPQMLNDERYFLAMDNFMTAADYVGEIYILGGEPFLNEGLKDIIERFSKYKNCGGITIFSNGTIIPDEDTLKCIYKYDVSIQISDYHLNKQKIKEFNIVLNKWNIKHVIKEYTTWIRLGDVEKRNRSEKETEDAFSNCFFRKQFTMYRGKLYHCPRAAHGQQLGYYDADDAGDMIDCTDSSISKKQLTEFIMNKKAHYACRYCNGGNLYSSPIPAAKQKGDDK